MFSRMQFKGVWRDYQVQVLDGMADHLANGRLHVVAAPGAGKTVLGLEIVRRLGRRALVFAPTVAIRDQWENRLANLFLEEPLRPDEISHDLAEPRTFTLATYQALDAFGRADDIAQLIQRLNAIGPITLVLDEAHHLRRAWWTSIARMVDALDDLRIVALTATPPYDASLVEWGRYESLCGAIDIEIGIPELVRNGDLCPHQDHLILSPPTEDTLALLEARRRAIWQLQHDLRRDNGLLDELETHPWLQRPEDHVEAILEAPEILSAVLVLLNSAGRKPPTGPLKLLGVSRRSVPMPSLLWLERLAEGLRGGSATGFQLSDKRRKLLQDRLHRLGLIEDGRVRLRETRSMFQLMASNIAKLESIAQIARAENAALGGKLRMVILSDHVRTAELPVHCDAEFRPSKLGVVPIFEHLRRAGVVTDGLAVLTGSLVIIPRNAFAAFKALIADLGADPSRVKALDMPACPGHLKIDLAGPTGARAVQLVTALFARGEIRILVGTQSLLGEGWDAPTLNSLILASNTASFMLSNQMRGRAIRVDPDDTGKVANIWHLATVEPPATDLASAAVDYLAWGDLRDDDAAALSDTALLGRRFRAFEGISNGQSTLIESGIGRLAFSPGEDHRLANDRTFSVASDRQGIARRWAASLGAGGPRARVRETAAPNYSPQSLAWSDTLQASVWSALSAAAFAISDELSVIDSTASIGQIGMILAGASALASLPKLARAARLVWRNGSIEGSLEQVGQVVLRTLQQAGLASDAELESGRFEVRSSLDGRKDVVLRNVSRSTERQVMQAIGEVLGPIQNPRYILVRRSRLGWRVRTDYHAVPAALGARKEWAERFADLWRKRVGFSELVFTRTANGRRVLLRARAKSLAAGLQRSVDRRSAWL